MGTINTFENIYTCSENIVKRKSNPMVWSPYENGIYYFVLLILVPCRYFAIKCLNRETVDA